MTNKAMGNDALNYRKTIGKWWFNGILWDLPSGNDQLTSIAMENGPFMVDLPRKTMVIFHNYVKLPEGICW